MRITLTFILTSKLVTELSFHLICKIQTVLKSYDSALQFPQKTFFFIARACCVQDMHIYININFTSRRWDQELFVLFLMISNRWKPESMKTRIESNRIESKSSKNRIDTDSISRWQKPNWTELLRDVRRSQTTKFARVFNRCVALFISERFDVSIKNRSRYDYLDDWSQKLLYLFMQMSISRIVIENCNVNACFIAFLILFKSMNFQTLYAIREKFDFVSQKIFVEMRMWFDNWLRLKLVMQCFNLFVKWIVMNVRFMILMKLRTFHVIEFFDKIRVRLRFCIMSNKSFVAMCCVE